MSFQTVDRIVIQYYTYLISQIFGFVLAERNKLNNLEIKTSLPYKNNTIQTNNNQNKSNNPKADLTTKLKILRLQLATSLLSTYKKITEIAIQLMKVVSSKHKSQSLYKMNSEIKGQLHVMTPSMSSFKNG